MLNLIGVFREVLFVSVSFVFRHVAVKVDLLVSWLLVEDCLLRVASVPVYGSCYILKLENAGSDREVMGRDDRGNDGGKRNKRGRQCLGFLPSIQSISEQIERLRKHAKLLICVSEEKKRHL